MSGIASYTNSIAKLLEGSKVKLLDKERQLQTTESLKNIQLEWWWKQS